MSRRRSTITRAAEGLEWVSTITAPSSLSMIAVLELTLYAGAATATWTPSATRRKSKRVAARALVTATVHGALSSPGDTMRRRQAAQASGGRPP
jgi:hypothetical protein